MKITKKQKVIEFIKAAGRNGLTFSEIQRFVVEMNGLNYDAIDGANRRRYRGYWCVMLCGTRGYFSTGRNYTPGILASYCYKNLQGYYIHKDFYM
jgi:hypothetical protein